MPPTSTSTSTSMLISLKHAHSKRLSSQWGPVESKGSTAIRTSLDHDCGIDWLWGLKGIGKWYSRSDVLFLLCCVGETRGKRCVSNYGRESPPALPRPCSQSKSTALSTPPSPRVSCFAPLCLTSAIRPKRSWTGAAKARHRHRNNERASLSFF
jgi:hypothetical protein